MYELLFLTTENNQIKLVFNKDGVEETHLFNTVEELAQFTELEKITDPEDAIEAAVKMLA